jgi:hypothetical protein
MNEQIKDVHTEHCCILHGCKYSDDAFCTVVTRKADQSYICESCDMSGIRDLKMLQTEAVPSLWTYFMKEIPSEQEISIANKRGVKFAIEWSAQNDEDKEALPQEIKDLKVCASLSMFATHSGEMTEALAMSGIEMAIEAAYNYGKTRAGKA